MNKLLIILGIVLIVISIPVIVLATTVEEGSQVYEMMESIACNSPEKLIITRSITMDMDGESIEFFCEIEPGQRRDVTPTVVLLIIAGFMIPFGLGMFLVMFTSFRMKKQFTNRVSRQMAGYVSDFQQNEYPIQSTVINLRGNQDKIPPETQEMLNNVLGGFASSFTPETGKGSLTQRLKQLDEAYENDLISKDEYDRVRQAILDSMDD